jgi:predicted ATPase
MAKGGNQVRLNDLDEVGSILSQMKDPETYPDLAFFSNLYSDIRIYREWNFGSSSFLRAPQPTDLFPNELAEDFSNLWLFLNYLRRDKSVEQELLSHLRDFQEGIEDFGLDIFANQVQLFLNEGDFIIPSSRLSDGTLKFISLLAILCDPNPPALICMEEPELGLHPDSIAKVAQLLIAASQRTQLILTTHSDLLVDALSNVADAVVVAEKEAGQTLLTRLSQEKLNPWLEEYSLGNLWLKGKIGGVRW